jgi:hypothetical protein
MQVLVKNPFEATLPAPIGLYESFWSKDVFIMTEDFDFSQIARQESVLSSYLSIDMKVSFLVSLLRPGGTLGCYGLGAMGVLACYFQTRAPLRHDLSQEQFEQALRDYLPQEQQARWRTPDAPLDQVLLVGEREVTDGQSRLKRGGRLLIGKISGPVRFSPHPDDYEAFGSLWPEGESTEFGWRFTEDVVGLEGLEFAQFLKRR